MINLALVINGVIVAQSGSTPDPYLFFKEIDIGIKSMVRYDFIQKNTNCLIQFSHNLGLMDVVQDGKNPVMRNSTFSLLLGISINKMTVPD